MYNLKITNWGPHKLMAIKALMDNTQGLGLKDCKRIVDKGPHTVETKIPMGQAQILANALKTTGAVLEIVEAQ